MAIEFQMLHFTTSYFRKLYYKTTPILPNGHLAIFNPVVFGSLAYERKISHSHKVEEVNPTK